MVELPLPPSSGLFPVWVSVMVLFQTLVIVELARKVLVLVMLLFLNVHTLVLGTTVAKMLVDSVTVSSTQVDGTGLKSTEVDGTGATKVGLSKELEKPSSGAEGAAGCVVCATSVALECQGLST